MQTARELFDAGHLAQALEELNKAVKAKPSDPGLRTFLFELLCIQGALDRAAKQLDVLGAQATTPGIELAIQTYRSLLAAEEQRRAVFNGDALPKFIVPPGPHVERYVMLVKKMRAAGADELSALVAEAEDSLPALSGERDGQAFSSFRDADDRMPGVLEVFHEGEYLWVPLDQVAMVSITPPRKLRETLWAQARLELVGQAPGDVFIPVRYPDSHLHANEQVRLGRLTEFEALHDCMVLGHGQRVFLIDDEEASMLDLKSLSLSTSAESA